MPIDTNTLKLTPSDIRGVYGSSDASPHFNLDVFDLASVAMGIVTPSGYWLSANPAMSTLFGYTAADFLGIHINELIHPDDVEMALAEHRKLVEREIDHIVIEARSLQNTGDMIWTRQHITAIRVPARSGVYLLVQIENIHELKMSEALRYQQADLHQTLIQHLPGVLITVFDKDFRYQLVEGQGLENHGLTNDSILGLTPWEVVGGIQADQAVQHFKAALAGETRNFETERDGRYYQVRVAPLRDEHGVISSAMAVYIDVTGMKATEASRQRRGEIYRAIVRNLPGAIAAVFDKDLRYLVVDGHGLADLNLTPEMVEGKTAMEFWGDDRRDSVVRHLQATIDGEPQSYEGVIQGREYEIRSVPIPEPDGSINIGVLINFDITERKEHEREMKAVSEALAKSNRDLEEFASVAAHDLRAPLVTIHGLATILAEDYPDSLDDDGQYLVSRIVANADQMQTLLAELLDISRVGRSESDFTLISLQDAIEHVREHQKISLERRKVKLTADMADVTLLANWTRIVQLFSNLIDNAVKYTPSERAPQIEISVIDEGDSWLISVADNGIGISEDHREMVFEMFQRLRDGQQLNPHGTGIGLALVNRIVGLHGGQIWIDPDVTEGTTFRMTFPKPDPSEDGVVE